MLIVLDTNVLQADLAMRTGNFAVLVDYLRKTQSRVVMPLIVMQELTANVEREIRGRLTAYLRAKGNLDTVLPSELPDEEINIEQAVAHYLGLLRMRLNLLDHEIVPYKPEYLNDVVLRAIARRKPCSEKGEEIRDAVLWLTVLDIASQSPDRTVAFVSQNTRQFAIQDALHPELSEEAARRNLSVRYFPSLEAWAREQASKVTFITTEWLSGVLPLDRILDAARGIVESYAERYVDEHLPSSEFPTGYFNLINGELAATSFFVYEMTDGSLRVEAVLLGEVEVECEVEHTVRRTAWDYRYDFDPLLGSYEYTPVPEERTHLETEMRLIHPSLEVLVDAIVVDGKLTDWMVTGGSLG